MVLKNTLGGQLKQLCETRWVEHHDSVLQFLTNIEKVSVALEIISRRSNEDSSAQKTQSYECSIPDSDFLVSLYCLAESLDVACNLSKLLQTEHLDVQSASEAVFTVKSLFRSKRLAVEKDFKGVFMKATAASRSLGGEMNTPRIAQRQSCRSNAPFRSAEEYFRRNIYIPLLDWVMEDFSSRFSDVVMDVFRINIFLAQAILAKNVVLKTADIKNDISTLCQKYSDLFGLQKEFFVFQLKSEYEQWIVEWNRDIDDGKVIPSTVIDAYNACHPVLFPLIKKLFLVLLSLPVGIAGTERSFSALRLLKSYVRSRCGESHFNGLAMLYIHRHIHVDPDNVINWFSEQKETRKQNLLL